VETTVIENIRRAVEMVYDYKDIAVITGDAGTGKTTAIHQYEKESHAAIALYAYKDRQKQDLIVKLARALDVYPKGSKAVVIERIVEELKGRDVVLIIDQADYLSDASLELLRCIIVDMAEVGLVLVDMPRLKMKLENLVNGHEQLLSRVGTFLRVERMKAVDAVKIIQSVW
jgi:DNA transposition AAA+ family ATPase